MEEKVCDGLPCLIRIIYISGPRCPAGFVAGRSDYLMDKVQDTRWLWPRGSGIIKI